MAGKTRRDFKSEADYKKWLAYGHMQGAFKASPGHTPVSIKGKPHTVKHVSTARRTSTTKRR